MLDTPSKIPKIPSFMLSVENISKSFGAVKAVQNVGFEIRRGEVVGLLGPNGAGKTTTMRLVTGFLKPDAGQIRINDISVAQDPIQTRSLIGYLPENAPLYTDMEVTEFLNFCLRLRKIGVEKRKNHLKEAVELCALQEVIGRSIGELSRGYRQRVCLAQALIHKPPLLILDEPTSGLDPHQIQEIRNLIKAIGRERTVILSTHIMQEVQAVCQRALIIARGKLVGEGTLEELTKKKKGKSRYFVKIRATRIEIEKKAGGLGNLKIENLPAGNGTWQEVVFESEQAEDQSEKIFHWVVENHWSLSELKKETTSLEEVFLELTKQ